MNDLEVDQAYGVKVALLVYLMMSIFFNGFLLVQTLFHVHEGLISWDIISVNLFFAGVIVLFCMLPAITRYILLRNWSIFEEELIVHFSNRKQSPSTHWLLSDAFTIEVTMLVMAFYRRINQLIADRPTDLNLRRKAPFLLFQQANLLLAP